MYTHTITNSFNTVLSRVINFIPQLISAIVLIVIGIIAASIMKALIVRALHAIAFDKLAEKIGFERFLTDAGVKIDPIELVGKLVYWFILLIFIVAASTSLNLPVVTGLLNSIYLYIPRAVSALIIIFVGLAAANFVSDIVRGSLARVGYNNLFAEASKWIIVIFAAMAALSQLDIATNLINIAFTGIVTTVSLGVGLALGLAFGLGGRDAASRAITNFINSVSTRPTALPKGSMPPRQDNRKDRR